MTTLAQVKAYLEITDNTNDVRLQAILDECESFRLDFLGDISLGTKTETVEKSMIKNDLLPFKIGNVTKINTINGTDFTTKLNGTDYVLRSDGQAQVLNLLNYVLTGDFDTFTISYEAGYATEDKEIVALVSNYVGAVFAQDFGREVSKESL